MVVNDLGDFRVNFNDINLSIWIKELHIPWKGIATASNSEALKILIFSELPLKNIRIYPLIFILNVKWVFKTDIGMYKVVEHHRL
ncbi:MAG: hypothetical protein BWX92_02394 [Deltaproteobacteria bacterium ADurb.Bin135]|nr:MAG: hypothetical protein BWX92_02394 [Deltaproteobacteria bacterium ADurb.Bin135]